MTDRNAQGAAAGGGEVSISENADERRYEARIRGELAGWVDYGRVHSRLVALHTEVLPEFGGQGIGSMLVRHVLEAARSAGLTVTPRCPFFVAHFQRHPEDADLLAPGVTLPPPEARDTPG